MYYMPLTADAPESADETPMNALSGVTADDEAAIAASDALFEKKSELIRKLAVKKDGGYSGDLVSREQLDDLKEQARSAASNAAERILNGEADIYPTENACTFCPYGAVCRFDRQLGCRVRTVQKRKLSDLLQEGGEEE